MPALVADEGFDLKLGVVSLFVLSCIEDITGPVALFRQVLVHDDGVF